MAYWVLTNNFYIACQVVCGVYTMFFRDSAMRHAIRCAQRTDRSGREFALVRSLA
jgi:hypothetical protein